MRELLRSTNAYRAIKEDRLTSTQSQATLVLFPDGKYLRALLKECAKAFFGAEDGSRESALIDSESYIDCLIYPAAGNKLTAEAGGEIIDESMLRPVEGTKKLFVLDAFHTVTPLVQNKLLKVLEEPPQGVYFLLGAEAEYAVLPTVRSRMKTYTVVPFAEEAIEAALGRNYREGNLKQAAVASGGIYSVAENLLLGGGDEFLKAREFLTTDEIARFCKDMGDYAEKETFFSALSLLLRDILFYLTGNLRHIATADIEPLTQGFTAGSATAAMEKLKEAETRNRFNANFAQSLFLLAMEIRKEKEKWQR